MLPAMRMLSSVGFDARTMSALRHRHFDVVLAERVARMVDPVVDLELNPRRGEEVQRTRREEVFAVQQLAADDDGIGLVEQFGR